MDKTKLKQLLAKMDKVIPVDNRDILEELKNIKTVLNKPEKEIVIPKFPTIPEFPKEIKVSNFPPTPEPPEIKLPDIPMFPREMKISKPLWFDLSKIDLLLMSLNNSIKTVFNKISEFRIPKKAEEAIPVRLSDGKKFYEAITQVIGGGFGGGSSGGFKEVNATIREVEPTNELKSNASMVLTYDTGKLIKITKTISGTSYEKTLSYTGDDLTGVSTWSEV